MRYLKAAVVAFAGGVLLTAAVLAVQMVHANRVMTAQMADCEAALKGGGGICSGYAQFGGNGLPIAFVLGFAAAFAWFVRARRRPIQ